jgi:hypothetical protein
MGLVGEARDDVQMHMEFDLAAVRAAVPPIV